MTPSAFEILVSDGVSVSAILMKPARPSACYVFAHGAGAGMAHPFMTQIAEQLATRGVATLRYQFPYMEQGSRRPDRPAICHATVRAAVAAAQRRLPKTPLIAGGKSFGGRMTSQAQVSSPLTGVIGLAFMGYPWHEPKAPSSKRSEHLAQISIPLLFLQGTRDTLGDLDLVREQVRGLGPLATLHTVAEADHGFHVLVRSGRTDADVELELIDVFVRWSERLHADL